MYQFFSRGLSGWDSFCPCPPLAFSFHMFRKEATTQPVNPITRPQDSNCQVLPHGYTSAEKVLLFQQCLVKTPGTVCFWHLLLLLNNSLASVIANVNLKAFGGISNSSLNRETWVLTDIFLACPRQLNVRVATFAFLSLTKFSNGPTPIKTLYLIVHMCVQSQTQHTHVGTLEVLPS